MFLLRGNIPRAKLGLLDNQTDTKTGVHDGCGRRFAGRGRRMTDLERGEKEVRDEEKGEGGKAPPPDIASGGYGRRAAFEL